MDSLRRFLVVTPDLSEREFLARQISQFVAGAEFFYASDGTEAQFKLKNAEIHVALFAENLAKRNAFQLTEWLLLDRKLDKVAIIIMAQVPETEKFVDEVVRGRVHFQHDVDLLAKLEQLLARALNYISHGGDDEFHLRFVATGDVLMREGDKADNVYLVKKGRLKAVRTSNNQEVLLGHIEVGEFVGEMAYINGEPRSANVIAEASCELIEIPVERLDHVLFQKPAWSKALMKTLSRRLKSANISMTQ